MQSVPISNGEIIIDNTIHDECIFYDNSKTIDIPIMEHSEKLYMFSGLVFSPKNNINLPMLKCRFILKNGKTLEQSINIGTIDASDVWRAPYINSQSSIFLATVIRELQEIIPNGYARIFYIRGKSGTGKSRLIKEIENKACELSYKIIHIDFRDQNDVFAIRQLFCKWLCLPNPSDTISFEYQDFCNTIKENIVNEEYQQVLFDFLYCNKCEINTNILEKIFFMRTVDHPAIFTFDNIQEVSKDVQMLLWHISSSCRNRSLPIVFAFSTNTEMRIDEKNLLVSYLDNVGGEHTENYIISYVSCALIKEDAILIMQELLHLNQDTSKYIDSVVNKIGTLPLNILFFSKILAQTTDIFGQAHGKRFIKNSHLLNTKLADFLQDDKNRNNKMSEYICDNYPGHQPLFELIVLFEGNLPTSIAELCGFTMNTIKILCEDLVLRIGNDQTVIQFYNDQLFNYLLSKPLQIPRIFYEIIVDYYEGASEKEEKYYNIISNVYLKALISIGKKERAKSFGNKLLKKYKKLHSNRDVCYVCTQLCSLFSPENEPDEYVKVALIKADFLLERVNLYEAELFYEEIKYVIDTKSAFLSPEIITHFYHRYVNQKLHRGKYMEAIYALDEFESMADLTDDSYYIIHDRYCVAYFNLGNIIEAKKHIDKTIRRANKNNNMMWLSIASSDKAFAYFYNGGNKETIIHFFKQAVESHILIENNDISRDIEIKIQESLYLILREDIADAEKSIQKAINIAEKANYNYLMLPAYNLQAYILAYSKKYESALKVLKKAFSDAIIYENQHALISIYNNLGVIHILNGHNGYDDAIASFRSSEKLLKMHPEWSNDNLKYIGLKYNFQKIENNYIDKIDDKKIFLLCGGYCFLYQ